ncbi:MAG: cofactor-independent phosphoglycerate mutase [Clostridia bacterium]|nr:cofactor-independent phosphoglycerate mutase [Clostridia bacterium]
MKYVVILADGCADMPVEALGGKTPLDAADKPHMDMFARDGKLFLVKTIPDGMKPGSDVANIAVLGYDPRTCYTGRSSLEAASMGIELKDNQTTFRVNLVTLSDEANYADKTMLDYSAGEITTAEGNALMAEVEKRLGGGGMHFFGGVSYRNLCIWDNAPKKFNLTPPHDISSRIVGDYLPDNEALLRLMVESNKFLPDCEVNKKRTASGKNTANSLWIWGEGTKPTMENFEAKNSVRGAVVSAVDLVKGIAILAGMKSIDVQGATGTLSTNFAGKAQAAIDALLKDDFDLVYVHLEAPDECGHQGDAAGKIKSLELIDSLVIAPILSALEKSGEDYSFMLMPDHPTPVKTRTHDSTAVPCAIYRKSDSKKESSTRFCEADANTKGEYIAEGFTMMKRFLG